MISMDWFKGKSTENHCVFNHPCEGVPVNVPSSQSIDDNIPMKYQVSWRNHRFSWVNHGNSLLFMGKCSMFPWLSITTRSSFARWLQPCGVVWDATNGPVPGQQFSVENGEVTMRNWDWPGKKMQKWLVGGFKDFFPFHIWDVILPIDELICFKMVVLPRTRWGLKWFDADLFRCSERGSWWILPEMGSEWSFFMDRRGYETNHFVGICWSDTMGMIGCMGCMTGILVCFCSTLGFEGFNNH